MSNESWLPTSDWTIKSMPNVGWVAIREIDGTTLTVKSFADLGILLKWCDVQCPNFQNAQSVENELPCPVKQSVDIAMKS